MTELAAPQDEMASRRIELDVTGMTCVMCARRLEKALNRIGGVRATVKIATKIASVDAAPGVTVEQLRQAVERAGYQAAERIEITSPIADPDDADRRGPLRALLRWMSRTVAIVTGWTR
ncbi:heavy-metal-associated domain-containing protein [Mycolicibacterium brumae]|uniref:heavy-metal-associated domain-containing protein n=1 Tax=Mycolicibacterium brumae TaxID=85968 RepID=UPI000B131CE2|nr:heavy metal-associated domain-containing protein [Mycolicibacterium brumae]MCV7192244.1 heavy-metal-associated domain-containing protein [Mycolicibacterium brumae]UWW10459.1 heavy-metal-associated domain-containing protein [Mycolicibacterium brumae]